jgi:hypothetical protein
MLSEYIIGVSTANSLRKYVPTFSCVYGAFLANSLVCKNKEIRPSKKNKPSFYIMYEKIEGETLLKELKTNTITFEEWLNVFVQILISLEIAQRYSKFTHYDLHTSNVIIKRVNNNNYSATTTLHTYNVNDTSVVPVIIDYGHSCSVINNCNIGSYKSPEYGMLNFLVAGYDMYKFLIYSIYYTKNRILKNSIKNLLLFYGDNDPYSILKTPSNVRISIDQFCSKTTYSLVGSKTPEMFLNWIFEQDEYTNILVNSVNRSRNIEYYSSWCLQPSIRPKMCNTKCNNLILYNSYINIINTDSYLLLKYKLQILSSCNPSCKECGVIKSLIKYKINSLHHELIITDMKFLNIIFTQFYPEQSTLNDFFDTLFSIKLNSSDLSLKHSIIQKSAEILNFTPFMNSILFLYTIINVLQIPLQEYQIWKDEFKNSKQYSYYNTNILNIIASERKVYSLINTIHI